MDNLTISARMSAVSQKCLFRCVLLEQAEILTHLPSKQASSDVK
jgi:hypothetical protein